MTTSRQGDFLFVYGSLRNAVPADARTAASHLRAHGSRVAEASVRGRIYAVSWYPGLVTSHSNRDRVVGDLWRISDTRETLAALDDYEGDEYVRVRRTVRPLRGAMAGQAVRAWVYLYAWDFAGAPLIASGDYAEWLKVHGVAV